MTRKAPQPVALPTIYRLLSADPPWAYGDSLPGKGRGAGKHYDTMSVDKIARFPLPLMASDSWLLLWRTHTHQEEAKFVMRAWGFTYRSELVWVKTTNDGKRVRMGMGRTLRQAHEVCLIGSRGKPKPNDLSIPSVILAPRAEHSAKPKAIYDVAQRLTEGPYCELFAREAHEGWDSFGAEMLQSFPGAAE
jgi:N6-adenosine-specific RNA methylase IME4